MKKILLSLSILLSVGASAQLTQANQAPSVGNNFSTLQCDTTGIFGGAGGAGKNWSYTSINTTTAAVSNYSTVASTNTLYPSADVSVSASSTNISYYKSSATDLKYYGGNISFGIASGTIVYTSPAVYAVYPMTLNTTTTSLVSGSVTALGSTNPVGGTVTVVADATGTLNLNAAGAASGTTLKAFTDVVRLHTTENLQGSTNFLGTTITFTVTRNNYDYYSPSASRASLLSISNSTATLNSIAGTTVNPLKTVTVQKDYNVVGITVYEKETIELSVYPNPASTFVNFTTVSPEATKAVIYDLTGRIISTEVFEMGKAKMTTGNCANGLYLYAILNKDNQILKTGKFNISK